MNRRQRNGFSLVELAIVVGIMGVLAAIAIPQYRGMQLRAKRAELPVNLEGIKVAELAYDAEFDRFLATAATPSLMPDGVPAAWPEDGGAFDDLGWRPDGLVRGQYNVNVTGDATDFTGTAQSDCDGDGHYAELRLSKDSELVQVTADDVY